ncbi:MAG: coenzyme F420-0:L-glutamate ligase [Candidatus Bathyarchaeia archaeon]
MQRFGNKREVQTFVSGQVLVLNTDAIRMTGYRVLPVVTKYWKPGQDYLEEILRSVRGRIADDDFIVVSEKAISTARNTIVDENQVEPSLSARFIAAFWMRIVWGYFLGALCHLGRALLQHIREYPAEMGSRHKQVALQHAGLLQTLMFGSEGGIDGSNLPYAYVSLPLNDANTIAETIRERVWLGLQKKVVVMIVDTDKTYSLKCFHFTPRPRPIEGIHCFGGFIVYVAGRFFKLKKRATPLAVSGRKLRVEEALEIAELANRSRGFGAGRTVWDMARNFKVALTDVSWEMLQTVRHKPIVIVRSKR